ncbi:hypothetical protein UlMin_021918 [Ulmus minor]
MVRPKAKRERRSEGDNNNGNGIYSGRFKGVRMRKWGRWVAEVRQPNSRRRIWLGSYDTPQEAARAYDAAVFCLRGPSALLNFPANPPEIPSAAELSPSEIQQAACRHAHKFPAAEISPGSGSASVELLDETKLYGGELDLEGSSNGVIPVDEAYLDMADHTVHDDGRHYYDSATLWTF